MTTLADCRAALRMIRKTIETLGPCDLALTVRNRYYRGMLAFRPLLVIFAITLAALGLVPSRVHAHAGHHHHVVADPNLPHASGVSAEVSLQHHSIASRRSDDAGSTGACMAGCCAAGLNCCALALASDADTSDDATSSPHVRAGNWRRPPARPPEAMPEPPRARG